MKTVKHLLKPISNFLAFLILLQGCVIYKKKPSSLDEAVNADTRVRIETKDNQVLKFKRIVYNNGQYLGISKTFKVSKKINTDTGLIEERRNWEQLETPLIEDNIEKIIIKNKFLSTFVPIAFTVTLGAAIIIPYYFPWGF